MEEISNFEQQKLMLGRISESIDDLKNLTASDNAAEENLVFNNADIVIRAFQIFIDSTDPLLISTNNLQTISTSLDQLEGFLQNYRKNYSSQKNKVPRIVVPSYNSPVPRPPDYLKAIVSQIESVKDLFPFLIPQPNESLGIAQLRETVVSSRKSASQHIRLLSEEFDAKFSDLQEDFALKKKEIQDQFTASHNEINDLYGERLSTFETDINEKQAKFSEEISAALIEVKNIKNRAEENNVSIDSQKDRLDHAITEFQKQFSERIAEFQKLFSNNEEDRRKRADNAIKQHDASYNNFFKKRQSETDQLLTRTKNLFEEKHTELAENSNELLDGLRHYAQEAKVTVGLMSEKSLQNDYIIQADIEKTSARWWNGATFFTVILLLTAIGFIFVHTIIYPLPADQASYPQIISKFLITAVIGVIARWTSRQANRHLAEERRLRRLALELATINPFINSLDPVKQAAIKEILVMKYYGNLSEEKAPFGEVTPITDGDGGLKSIPETVIDKIRGKN